jgi:hypothetical protein
MQQTLAVLEGKNSPTIPHASGLLLNYLLGE